MSATNAVQEFLKLTQVDGPVSAARVEEAFNGLDSVAIEGLIGQKWKGGSLDTGHPGHATLLSMDWAGKDFISAEEVYPIMINDVDGKRKHLEEWGMARLREVRFRGVISTAMIYDERAIIDHFRYVDENTIAGAMDTKMMADAGVYYFYLTRL